jgi:hypothetical protein
MSDALNTFDHLVITLESEQRKEMLRKLADASEVQDELMRSTVENSSIVERTIIYRDKKLQEEPFFVRLWFAIVSFFTSTSREHLYDSWLVKRLGKNLAVRFADLIDPPQGVFREKLYQELETLKKCRDFFSELLLSYENNRGGFYLVLSSLLMPKTGELLKNMTDPFLLPVDQEIKKDARHSFFRELESIFLAIPEEERSRMYLAVQAIEWLRRFCEIPFGQMLSRFNVVPGFKTTCAIDSLEQEMKRLASVLETPKKIPVLSLESLFMFARQNEMDAGDFDLEKECSAFVPVATGHLSAIRQFRKSVPVADFVRLSTRNVMWEPDSPEKLDDWFPVFRDTWKQRFDEKWENWNRLHRRAMLEKNACFFLGVDSMPALSWHPWEGLWLKVSLRREFSLLFLRHFFNYVYPSLLAKPLKILLIEGDFYRRENLLEFTESFGILERQRQQLELFEARFSPGGDIGEGFAIVHAEKGATIKGKARIENLVMTMDAESELLIGHTQEAFHSLDKILGGILGVVRGAAYETLVNMASIQGKMNERFRKELEVVRSHLKGAMEILSEAEVLEKESL